MEEGEELRVTGSRRRASSVGASRWRRWAPREQRGAADAIPEEVDAEAAAAAGSGGGAGGGAAAAAGGEGLGAPLLGGDAAAAAAAADGGSPDAAAAAAAFARAAAFRRRHGVALAVAGGALGGLVLLPMEWARYECRGLPWVPGMSAGVVAAAPLATWLLHLFTTRKVRGAVCLGRAQGGWLAAWIACSFGGTVGILSLLPPPPPARLAIQNRPTPQATPRLDLQLHAAAAAGPGLASGALAAAATACCVLAVQSLGLAVAYPVMQAGLFLAGLWGVLLFGELRYLLPMLVYWVSGAVVLGGVALLTGAV